MKQQIKTFTALLTLLILMSFGVSIHDHKIKPIDEVVIGEQVWMTKNLNVHKFRNGDLIPQAVTDEEWNKAKEDGTAAWCYYENDSANEEEYGKLYNWYAVNDPRGIAPEGWHVPSYSEWKELAGFLGGEGVAGNSLKSESGWEDDGNGTNKSGFTGIAAGSRTEDGFSDGFNGKGNGADFWSSTSYNDYDAWYSSLSSVESTFYMYRGDKENGLSIRCIKDD
ncbi:fibrobacter succinogenes major paralogous domain-containing protein [Salibacter halophilus]|nr:fibrobacter succinogenes major paralogous domain-containing protein [Salibacter halophilus]